MVEQDFVHNQLLLSICIPTYNRREILESCLESIFNSDGYNEEMIEIVISDNHSSDGTEAFMQDCMRKHKNIVYNRNEKNIGGDRNFLKVLSLGNGKLLKLHNDYCLFTKFGLLELINLIKDVEDSKPFIFLDSREGLPSRLYDCPSMDTLLEVECLHLSWISSFVYWKEDFDRLENKDEKISTQFMQTDWALRICQNKSRLIIYFCDIFRRSFETRGGFNFVEIFSKFPTLFEPYLNDNTISKKTMDLCVKKVLESMLLWHYRMNIRKDKRFTFITDGNWDTIVKYANKYHLSILKYVLLLKVALFDSLEFLSIQETVRVFFIKKEIKRLTRL